MNAKQQPSFDADAYWAAHEFKKWVVVLSSTRRGRGRFEDTQTMYVRARTQAGAVRTARRESSLPRSARAFARLATPADLGCVPA